MKCQCEETGHFSYGCPGEAEHTIKTDFGTFVLCDHCYHHGHMGRSEGYWKAHIYHGVNPNFK